MIRFFSTARHGKTHADRCALRVAIKDFAPLDPEEVQDWVDRILDRRGATEGR